MNFTRWCVVPLLVGCGFDSFDTTVDIRFGPEEIHVASLSLNAHHSAHGDCAALTECRASLTTMLEKELAGHVDEGAREIAGELRVRDGEIDLFSSYILPFDSPVLAGGEGLFRLVEMDNGRRSRTALLLLLPASENTRPTVTVEGPHQHLRIPELRPGEPSAEDPNTVPPQVLGVTEAWTFHRGRSVVNLRVEGDEKTPAWAPSIPGLVESLVSEPIKRP